MFVCGGKPSRTCSHVPDIDRAAAHGLDGQIVQFRHRLRAGIHVDVVLERPDLGGARGQNQVLRADRIDHVQRRKALRLQSRGIQIHLHLPLFAAVGIRNRRSRHGDQSRADEVHARVEQLLLGEFVTGKAELQNRHGRCAVSNDQRRSRPRRQLPQLRLRNRRDLRNGLINVGVRLEKHLHYGDAVQRLRLDVLDVIDQRGQRALRHRRDPVSHVLRRTGRSNSTQC